MTLGEKLRYLRQLEGTFRGVEREMTQQEVVRAIIQEFPFLKLAEQISLLPFRDGFDGAFAAKFVRE